MSMQDALVAGNREILRLSRSSGGVRNVSIEPWNPTFDELVEATSRPEVGVKDGSYFVRGPCAEGATRSDEAITAVDLIVLDGDSRFDPATGETTTGAPHPSMVHEALCTLNILHHIYTSHSHGAEGKGNRYRVLIPVALGEDPYAFMAGVDHVLAKLHAAGVPLAAVTENYGRSQPWYLPRIRSEDATFLTYTFREGQPLDLEPLLADWSAQHRQLSAGVVVKDGEGEEDRQDTAIGRYLEKHGNDAAMATLLESKGYVLMGAAMMNGFQSYRFLAPASTSGQPGVTLFRTQRGRWRVFSFHNERDPLAVIDPFSRKRLAHDAFDLLRILEYGGDWNAALAGIDPRPEIRVFGGSLANSTREAIAVLAAQQPPSVFQRGTMLVRPAHLPDLLELNGLRIPKGSAILSALDPHSLRLKLVDAARFVSPGRARDPEEWKEIDPPQDLAKSVLGSVGAWDGLPVMVGIAEAPIMRPDGSIHDLPGYDPVTRMYYEGRAPALIGCADPKLADAKRAYEALLRPFAQFAFADPGLGRAVTLAYMLTLALRPVLPKAPLFAVSATAPGAGKGLLIEVCNLIVRGRDAAIMAPTGGKDADEETRKRITSILLQGGSSVLIDNWTSAIGGNSLNTLFTADEWSDRLLSKNETVTLPTRVTWAATGNNLVVRGDMVRRTLLAIIDPGVERPELRQFDIPNLTQHVQERRRDLLSALYTILQAYRAAGEPESAGPVLGRFEEWSRAVAAPIRWLGLPDPISTQELLRDEDPEAQNLSSVLSAWFEIFGSTWLTVAEVADPDEIFNARVRPGSSPEVRARLMQAMLEVASDRGSVLNRRRFSWYLRRSLGRVVEGYKLQKDPSSDPPRYRVTSINEAKKAAETEGMVAAF